MPRNWGESAQELRRRGGWVAGPHLTPRGKLDGGGVGPDTQRGVPEEWIKQAEPPGDL